MDSPGVDLKDYLDTLGTLGQIRVGFMPPSPDVSGVIYEYGGLSVQGLFGVTGVGHERPTIQVVFRGAPNDYSGPMGRARIAWQALASIQPGVVGNNGAVYLTVTPQQSPFSLGRDPNERYEIACNYYITKEHS